MPGLCLTSTALNWAACSTSLLFLLRLLGTMRLSARQRAEFATASRILSCLVTESLVTGLYLPLENGLNLEGGVAGFAVVLTEELSPDITSFRPDHILAIIPLHHHPIFHPSDDLNSVWIRIGLLDPSDMIPLILEIESTPQDDRVDDVLEVTCSSLRSAEI